MFRALLCRVLFMGSWFYLAHANIGSFVLYLLVGTPKCTIFVFGGCHDNNHLSIYFLNFLTRTSKWKATSTEAARLLAIASILLCIHHHKLNILGSEKLLEVDAASTLSHTIKLDSIDIGSGA